MRPSIRAVAPLLLMLALTSAGPAAAQAPNPAVPPGLPPLPTLLTISASASVARAPDQLRMTAAVLTTGPTAAEAMAANSARMNAVLAALKAAGVADRDLQTTGLSLNPQYRYENNQPPILTGYQARNSISLRTSRLADAGKLVDSAIKAGANEVQGPDYALADPDAALDAARTAAVAKARARATLYAKAAGLAVKRIASISEAGTAPEPGPRPMLKMAMAEADAAPPVQPGEMALTAQVTMVFELDAQP